MKIQRCLFAIALTLVLGPVGASAGDAISLLGTGGDGLIVMALPGASSAPTAEFTLAIAADLHVTDENAAACRNLAAAMSARPGVSAAALLGDLVAEVGTSGELARVKDVVQRFSVPLYAVPGNHDYLYADALKADGKKSRGTPAGKAAKLERFRTALGQARLRFSLLRAGHLLVFLPLDELEGKSIATLSEKTLRFLSQTLEANRDVPTVVLCHAPLDNGTADESGSLSAENAFVQPKKDVTELLRANPQVFLWVAGHRHLKPSSDLFSSAANRVDGVTVVNVPSAKTGDTWFLTLELSPGAALVRTIDAKTGAVLHKHDRRFEGSRPAGAAPGASTALPDPLRWILDLVQRWFGAQR